MGCSQSSQKETLTVGMELAYPPFETKDEAGNPTGISADFMKDFGEYIGKDIRIENVSWDGLIPSLQTGKVDMVMSSMTITDERKETVDFSINVISMPFLQLAGDVLGRGISTIFFFFYLYFLYNWWAFVPVVNIVFIFELLIIGLISFGMISLIEESLDDFISHSFITSYKAIWCLVKKLIFSSVVLPISS